MQLKVRTNTGRREGQGERKGGEGRENQCDMLMLLGPIGGIGGLGGIGGPGPVGVGIGGAGNLLIDVRTHDCCAVLSSCCD